MKTNRLRPSTLFICALALVAGALSTNARSAEASTSATVIADTPQPAPLLSSGLDDIVKLSKSHVDESVILTFIQYSPVAYQPTADDLINLRAAGVSPNVTAAVIQHGDKLRQNPAPASTQTDQPAPAAATQTEPQAAAETQSVVTPPSSYAAAPAYVGSPAFYYYDYGYPYFWPGYFSYGYYSSCWLFPSFAFGFTFVSHDHHDHHDHFNHNSHDDHHHDGHSGSHNDTAFHGNNNSFHHNSANANVAANNGNSFHGNSTANFQGSRSQANVANHNNWQGNTAVRSGNGSRGSSGTQTAAFQGNNTMARNSGQTTAFVSNTRVQGNTMMPNAAPQFRSSGTFQSGAIARSGGGFQGNVVTPRAVPQSGGFQGTMARSGGFQGSPMMHSAPQGGSFHSGGGSQSGGFHGASFGGGFSGGGFHGGGGFGGGHR